MKMKRPKYALNIFRFYLRSSRTVLNPYFTRKSTCTLSFAGVGFPLHRRRPDPPGLLDRGSISPTTSPLFLLPSSSRRWSPPSSSGGPRWNAQATARHSSFSSLKPIVDRVRSNRRSTWSGTKFKSPTTLNSGLKRGYGKKQLGIGATAGFIGGSGYGYGSGLASYSVYHECVHY